MHSWSQMMLTSRHSSTSRKIQTMSALWCRDKIDIMNSWAYLSPLLTNNNARLYRECVRPCVLCAQTCLTLRDPMNCGPPGSSVCGISQARILEWVAISYSRGSPRPQILPQKYPANYFPFIHFQVYHHLSICIDNVFLRSRS